MKDFMAITWSRGLVGLLILMPVFIFLGYAYSLSNPLFREDDFHLLKTIVWMRDVDGILPKFQLLIQQHNEHRIILPRLITWLDYKIQGSIHWPVLILFANLLWVGVLWFFWKAFRSFNVHTWVFIPVPLILLHPQYRDNINWAISILQQSDIVFWHGLLIFLLAKKRWYWAMLVAVVATFTHGNGIFSFLLGIIFCCLDRNWFRAIKWALALVVVATIYFWGFEKGQNVDFYASLSEPSRLVMAFFAFLGAMGMIFSNKAWVAVALGLFYVLVLGTYLFPKLKHEITDRTSMSFFDKLLLGNIIFLGITATLVAVSRSWSGLESVTASRYQHYSSYLACWVYLTLIVMIRGRLKYAFAGVAVALAVGFNSLSYFFYHQQIAFRENWGLADAENWRNHRFFLYNAKSFNDNITETYARSEQMGICVDSPSFLTQESGFPEKFQSVPLEVTTQRIREKGITDSVSKEYVRIVNSNLTGESFICLEKEGLKPYWLPTLRSRTAVRELVLDFLSVKPGFSIDFSTELFIPGVYKIGILNRGSLIWTPQTLIIRGS